MHHRRKKASPQRATNQTGGSAAGVASTGAARALVEAVAAQQRLSRKRRKQAECVNQHSSRSCWTRREDLYAGMMTLAPGQSGRGAARERAEAGPEEFKLTRPPNGGRKANICRSVRRMFVLALARATTSTAQQHYAALGFSARTHGSKRVRHKFLADSSSERRRRVEEFIRQKSRRRDRPKQATDLDAGLVSLLPHAMRAMS